MNFWFTSAQTSDKKYYFLKKSIFFLHLQLLSQRSFWGHWNVSLNNILKIIRFQPWHQNAASGEFSLGVVIYFSSLAALWCQGSSNDSQWSPIIKSIFCTIFFVLLDIQNDSNMIETKRVEFGNILDFQKIFLWFWFFRQIVWESNFKMGKPKPKIQKSKKRNHMKRISPAGVKARLQNQTK